MKLRFGFISNSSSSSFMLCFPEVLHDKMDLDKFIIEKTRKTVAYDGEETLLDYVSFLWDNCWNCTEDPDAKAYLKKHLRCSQSKYHLDDFKTYLRIDLGQDAMKEGDSLSNKLATRFLEEDIYQVLSSDVLICLENHH